MRNSFDSGIEEPGPNEIQEEEGEIEDREASDAVTNLASSIASDIIHDVKERESLAENIAGEENKLDANEDVDDKSIKDEAIDDQKPSTRREPQPLETIDPSVVDSLGNFIKKEEDEDSNILQYENLNVPEDSQGIVEEENYKSTIEVVELLEQKLGDTEVKEKVSEAPIQVDSSSSKGEELKVSLDPSTPLVDLEEKEKEIPRTPHPFSRIEVLRKQESEEQSHNSLKPNCHSPHENRDIDEEEEEDEGELQKLSWDSDCDERIDLGLEDGTPLKVQV